MITTFLSRSNTILLIFLAFVNDYEISFSTWNTSSQNICLSSRPDDMLSKSSHLNEWQETHSGWPFGQPLSVAWDLLRWVLLLKASNFQNAFYLIQLFVLNFFSVSLTINRRGARLNTNCYETVPNSIDFTCNYFWRSTPSSSLGFRCSLIRALYYETGQTFSTFCSSQAALSLILLYIASMRTWVFL